MFFRLRTETGRSRAEGVRDISTLLRGDDMKMSAKDQENPRETEEARLFVSAFLTALIIVC